MRLLCAPADVGRLEEAGTLRTILYGRAGAAGRASVGGALRYAIRRERLSPEQRAWDLLSIANSVMVADAANVRTRSPDGWTREFELEIAVTEPDFWNGVSQLIADALAFLTTDKWHLEFIPGGAQPPGQAQLLRPQQDSVALLSGGLDSLIGCIDLAAAGTHPLVISKIVRGDAEKQDEFARAIGQGLRHIQLNDNAVVPKPKDTSQRARSIIFLAFGVLVASSLEGYQHGGNVPLYVCENGFIAINPPLTGSRVGSLSTRTTHPQFLALVQDLLDAAEIRVSIRTPYATMTKGEMLLQCADQPLLREHAGTSTSCGRFQKYGYNHCGRCVPCQVRRAAFLAWGQPDPTFYQFDPLGQNDSDHAGFDDVRSVGMALAAVRDVGFNAWLGSALSWPRIANREELRSMLERGLAELGLLHTRYGVR